MGIGWVRKGQGEHLSDGVESFLASKVTHHNLHLYPYCVAPTGLELAM